MLRGQGGIMRLREIDSGLEAGGGEGVGQGGTLVKRRECSRLEHYGSTGRHALIR